jgi:hypothetical protein
MELWNWFRSSLQAMCHPRCLQLLRRQLFPAKLDGSDRHWKS